MYFRDRTAFVRLIVAAALSRRRRAADPLGVAPLPGLRQLQQHGLSPGAAVDWPASLRSSTTTSRSSRCRIAGTTTIAAANVWLPVLVVTAFLPGRSRIGFYAWLAVLTQLLLRLNTPEAGAGFDRIQHMLPMLTAPALAGFVLRAGGTRKLAAGLLVVIAPVRLHGFLADPARPDAAGVQPAAHRPHRGQRRQPRARRDQPAPRHGQPPHAPEPTTPFDVHFEGLLPGVAGQRFYSQMIDGWVWNIYRGQVVGAAPSGTSDRRDADRRLRAEMPMGRRHLFVWTEDSRDYLADERAIPRTLAGGRWSQFERPTRTHAPS